MAVAGAINIRGIIEAEPGQQIFRVDSGEGAFSFSYNTHIDSVYAEWWGAAAGGDADQTQNTAAFNAALEAIATVNNVYLKSGGTLKLLTGAYHVNGTIGIRGSVLIKGNGMQRDWNRNYTVGSHFFQHANATLFDIDCSVVTEYPRNVIVTMNDFSMWSTTESPGAGTAAIKNTSGGYYHLDRIYINGGWEYGIFIDGARLYLSNSMIKGVSKNGILAQNTDGARVTTTTIEGTRESGIKSTALILWLDRVETFSCGADSSADGVDYYAVDAIRAYITGGYYNNDYNEIRLSAGSIIGAYIEWAGNLVPVGSHDSHDNSNGRGIVVSDSGGTYETVHIIGNTIYSSNGSDIYANENGSGFTNVIVSGNYFIAAGSHGSGNDLYSIYQGSSGPPMTITGNFFKSSEVLFANDNVNFSNNQVVTSDSLRDAVTFNASTTGHTCIGNNIHHAIADKNELTIGSGATVQLAGNTAPQVSGSGRMNIRSSVGINMAAAPSEELEVHGDIISNSIQLTYKGNNDAYTGKIYLAGAPGCGGDHQISYAAGIGYLCMGVGP